MSPALSDLPVRDVGRALRVAGFERVRVKGSHAIYRDSDGRVVVVPEHGTIKRGTLASILRQAGPTTAEFLKLLDWLITPGPQLPSHAGTTRTSSPPTGSLADGALPAWM